MVVVVVGVVSWNMEPEAPKKPPKHYVCHKCQQGGHYIKDCPLVIAENKAREASRKGSTPPEGYVCKKCNQPGHFIRECPQATAGAGAGGAAAGAAGSGAGAGGQPPAGYICKKCNQPGHFLRYRPFALLFARSPLSS